MNSSLDDNIRSLGVNKIDTLINDKYKSLIIEKSIYNYCINNATNKNITKNWENSLFKRLYINILRNIYANLNKKGYVKNNYLLDAVLNGIINLENIATMTNIELFPDRWKHLIEEKARKDKLFCFAKRFPIISQ